MTSTSNEADGRRLRRERGRSAVMDALIDHVLDLGTPPTAAEVAVRAGVSQASLFRYFATLDDLRHAAIGRYFERFGDLIEIPAIGDGDLSGRVERFVAARDGFYERTAPMARLVRRQTADVDEIAATLERLRSTFVDQIDQHFAPELASLEARRRRQRLMAIAALTSFEAWEQLAPLGPPDRRAALSAALADLLPAS